mgnify:CR=1 FL=1
MYKYMRALEEKDKKKNAKDIKDKDKDKDKAAKVKRKREKMIESGLSFLRQKTPYMWSSNL